MFRICEASATCDDPGCPHKGKHAEVKECFGGCTRLDGPDDMDDDPSECLDYVEEPDHAD